MIHKIAIAALTIFVWNVAQGADAKAPAGVSECVLSLPSEVVANVPRVERQKALKRAAAGGPMQVLDEKNGYVHLYSGDKKSYKDQYNIFVALFPSPAEHPIVGVHAANYFLDCWPKFFRWTGTNWKDVTTEVVPSGVYPKFGFDLPQKGTTVNVRAVGKGEPMDLEEKVAFRMKWVDGKFAK